MTNNTQIMSDARESLTGKWPLAIGTFLIFGLLIFLAIAQKEAQFWIVLPLTGYGFAWVGHAFFEKNKPATFKHPLWSLRGDFTLFFDILIGRRGFDATKD